MKTTLAVLLLAAAMHSNAYDLNYYPNYPNRYQREADRNEMEFRRREQENRINRLESDLRYQTRLEQIDREHRDVYGERINPLKPNF